jgi:septal ring factor EnvC (AmiA/AmiB activator)
MRVTGAQVQQFQRMRESHEADQSQIVELTKSLAQAQSQITELERSVTAKTQEIDVANDMLAGVQKQVWVFLIKLQYFCWNF